MHGQFSDITLGEYLPNRSHHQEGGLFRIYLQLSERPPREWSEIFAGVWRHVMYNMKRAVSIHGDAIWIECVPEEVKQYHRAELDKAFAEANQQYREWLERQDKARIREEEEQRRHRQRLQSLDT
jgi:hypothetical protein